MIADFHNDFLTNLNLTECKKYLHICEKQKVKIFFASIFTTEFKGDKFKKVKLYIKKFKKLKTNIKLYLHIEDVGFLNNENIDEFLSLGVYSCGLTWNYKNAIGGGAFSEGGLSEFGKIVVNKLFENNILVDLAHANKQTFWDVIDIAKQLNKKVCVTHTCFSEVYEHKRNIDRKQIEAILSLGGIIGICLVSEFIDGTMHASKNSFKKQIDYFLKNFGKAYLALGTDFNGTEKLPIGINNYDDLAYLSNNIKYKVLEDFLLNQI